jgi:hypothetical protein
MESAWVFSYFMPSEEPWRKYGDRLVVCTLNDPQFNKIEGPKRQQDVSVARRPFRGASGLGGRD